MSNLNWYEEKQPKNMPYIITNLHFSKLSKRSRAPQVPLASYMRLVFWGKMLQAVCLIEIFKPSLLLLMCKVIQYQKSSRYLIN